MNAVHVSSLRHPAKEFPRAMFVAMGLVLLIFVLPALAISWVVPAEQLSLTAGVMQAFDAVFAQFGAQWLTPVLGIMLVAASLGGMLTWLAGPSKGLLLISRQEGYLVAGVLVALLVIAMSTYRSGRSTAAAQAKADQLAGALAQQGLRSPSQEVLVRVLGDDGGAVCRNPGQALNKASLLAQLANGASGPGARPVIADSRLVRGEALVIQVYCPDQLAGFQKVVDGLDLSEGVVNG